MLVWEESHLLRANDFDTYGRIKPSAVLDLFQNAAGAHAKAIGVGFDAMMEREMLWVLVRVKFRVLQSPTMYSEVTVRTWPLPPVHASYRRETVMLDAQGRELVIGTSEWVFVHVKTRRLVSARDVFPPDAEYETRRVFEEKDRRIPDFDDPSEPYAVTPAFCDIDVNGHVNNTRYADYVLNALSPTADREIETFRMEYRREVMRNETLFLRWAEQEGQTLVRGESDGGETRFCCAIAWKNASPS